MVDFKIKIFADCADINQIISLSHNPVIKGFTTNPTLMRKAGVTNYEKFARSALLNVIQPISFEVFADELEDMVKQARIITTWGPNVYVKIPITNTQGDFTGAVLRELSEANIKLNVTGILTPLQVKRASQCLSPLTPAIISVFAGRIADTGTDPGAVMHNCKSILSNCPNIELLWASSRELLNIMEAETIGCDIITITPELLAKLDLIGKDLTQYSLETVQTFYNDAKAAGYVINGPRT